MMKSIVDMILLQKLHDNVQSCKGHEPSRLHCHSCCCSVVLRVLYVSTDGSHRSSRPADYVWVVVTQQLCSSDHPHHPGIVSLRGDTLVVPIVLCLHGGDEMETAGLQSQTGACRAQVFPAVVGVVGVYGTGQVEGDVQGHRVDRCTEGVQGRGGLGVTSGPVAGLLWFWRKSRRNVFNKVGEWKSSLFIQYIPNQITVVQSSD